MKLLLPNIRYIATIILMVFFGYILTNVHPSNADHSKRIICVGLNERLDNIYIASQINALRSDLWRLYQHNLDYRILDNLEKDDAILSKNKLSNFVKNNNCNILLLPYDGIINNSINDIIDNNKSTLFVINGGYHKAPNVLNYFIKWHEHGYIIGDIISQKTQSNKIGIILTSPTLSYASYATVNGLIDIATDYNKQVNIYHINDKLSISDAINNMKSNGIDHVLLISRNTEILRYLELANIKIGIIGGTAEIQGLIRSSVVAYSVLNLEKYLLNIIENAFDGIWIPKTEYIGIKNNIGMFNTHTTISPADIIYRNRLLIDRVISGNELFFKGPVYNQNNELIIEEGKSIDNLPIDKQLMLFFIKGGNYINRI